MKKILWILVIVFLVAASSIIFYGLGKGTATEVSKETLPSSAVTTSVEVTESSIVITPAPAETTIETTVAPVLGSRLNPAKAGDIITTEDLAYYGEGPEMEYTICMNSVVRGFQAEGLMEDFSYVEIPEGKELVLFEITFSLIKYGTPDKSFATTMFEFEYFDSSMTSIDTEMILPLDPFSAEMYEGGSTTGYACVISDIGEKTFAVYNNKVWFDISE